jgi:hypothetical protein
VTAPTPTPTPTPALTLIQCSSPSLARFEHAFQNETVRCTYNPPTSGVAEYAYKVGRTLAGRKDACTHSLLSYTTTRQYDLDPQLHHFFSERERYGHQSRSVRITNMRLSVPRKVILPREASPLVRTPSYAAEELVRFGGFVDLLVSFQIFGSDKAPATVHADAISGAVPARMVAARV